MTEAERFIAATDAMVRREDPPRAVTLPAQIAEVVRHRIQFGELRPLDPIREIPLAEEFDVSRGPVREALKILEREHLVTLHGRAGAIVRDPKLDELESVFRIRAELSALAMRMAAEAPDRPEELLSAIEAGAALLARLANDEDAPAAAYIQVRRRLGELIRTLGGAEYVGRLHREIELEIALHWASISDKSRQRASSAAWARIVRAIRGRDVIAAEAEGRRIVLESLGELRRQGGRFAARWDRQAPSGA